MLALRLIAALWVMWSALKKDAVHLLLALLISGFVCFVFLVGWYFVLFGASRDFISYDNIRFLVGVCDLLYIAAGLVVSCALLLSRVSARLGSDSS